MTFKGITKCELLSFTNCELTWYFSIKLNCTHHTVTSYATNFIYYFPFKLMDVFMVSTDGFMYRSWQLSFDKWASWDRTGYSAPKSVHAPVVHSMGNNFFNGKLNVFVHGVDGKLHHISQTTCDKVPNPWGWCTWGLWSTISGEIPKNSDYPPNSLSIGNNLHLGLEVN